MRIAFYTFLLVIPAGEYFVTGRLGLGAGVLVFVLLQLQSERAAALFARAGGSHLNLRGWRRAAAEAAPFAAAARAMHAARRARAETGGAAEHVELPPLGRKKARAPSHYGPRPDRDATAEIELPPFNAARRAPGRDHAPKILRGPGSPAEAPPFAPSSGAEPAPRREARPAFRPPVFNGAPHEVLGLDPEADPKQIVHAYRHWMQRYHPDHAPAEEAPLAAERARRLTEAKNAWLKSRAKRGAA